MTLQIVIVISDALFFAVARYFEGGQPQTQFVKGLDEV